MAAEQSHPADGLSFSGEPAEAREYVATFHARAISASPTYAMSARKAHRQGLAGVQLSTALDAEAATQAELTGDTQTIVINPSFLRRHDPPGLRLAPAVLQSRLRSSLLLEVTNGSLSDEFKAIDEQVETGAIDEAAAHMDPGPGEDLLLAQGHSREAVFYASSFERVECRASKLAAATAAELVAAGLVPHDDPDVRALMTFVDQPFPEALVRLVNSGHTQKYIDQFDQYLDESELRTPTADDFRSPTPEAERPAS